METRKKMERRKQERGLETETMSVTRTRLHHLLFCGHGIRNVECNITLSICHFFVYICTLLKTSSIHDVSQNTTHTHLPTLYLCRPVTLTYS